MLWMELFALRNVYVSVSIIMCYVRKYLFVYLINIYLQKEKFISSYMNEKMS